MKYGERRGRKAAKLRELDSVLMNPERFLIASLLYMLDP